MRASARNPRHLRAGLLAGLFLLTFAAALAPQTAQAQSITLTAKSGNGKVDLSWTWTGITGQIRWQYRVFGAATTTGAATAPTQTLTGLTNGQIYDIEMRALRPGGIHIATSNRVRVVPNDLVIVSATGLDSKIRVRWDYQGSEIGSSWEHQTFEGTGGGPWKKLADFAAARSGNIENLVNGRTYNIAIRYLSGGGGSHAESVLNNIGWVSAIPRAPTPTLVSSPNASVTVGSAGETVEVCYNLLAASQSTPQGSVTYLERREGMSAVPAHSVLSDSNLGVEITQAPAGITKGRGVNLNPCITLGVGAHTVTWSWKGRDGTAAVAATASTTVTITVSNGKTITLSASPSATITEGDSGSTDVTITFTLGEPAPAGFSVSLGYGSDIGTATASGKGLNPCDPPLLPRHTDVCLPDGVIVSIAEGETEGTKIVRILGDTRDEPDETINFIGYQDNWATGRLTLTIRDDDEGSTKPAAPTGLSAEAGNAQVELTWTDPEDDSITRYQVRQKKGNASWGKWTAISGSDADTTTHTVTGLENDSEYSFRIRARNDSGVGAQSAVVTATPNVNPRPSKPVLTATAGDRSVTLGWTAQTNIASWGYQYKSSGGWSSTTTVSDGGATSTTVTGLTGGTEYRFRLFARRGSGASSVSSVWSDEVTATPYALAAPVLTGATSNVPSYDLGVQLTWTHTGELLPSGATWNHWQMGYRLRGSANWQEYGRTTSAAVRSARTVSWLGGGYPEGAVVEVRVRGRGFNGNGLWSNIRTVTLSDDDDDRPALTIAGAPVSVATGATATYTVALTQAHAGTLSIISDDMSAATVRPASLTFTTGNYNTAKTVTVTGVGAGTATINHAFRLTGAAADAIPDAGTVAVTVNAVPGVAISPTSLTIDEGGSGAYTLRLYTAPAANVTVTVGGASGEVTVAGSPLTFTPANHGTAQTVTVSAGADADTANDTATLTHTSASTDNDYGAALAIDSVSVTVRDTTPGARGTDPAESPTGGMTYQQLDGAGGLAPEPVEYARELVVVPAGKTTVNIKSPVAAVATDTRHRVAAALGRRILVDESVHVRLALGGGMVFAEGKNVGDIGWRWSANPLRPPSSCTMENGAAFINPDHVTSAGKAIGTSLVAGRAGESVAVFRLETGADDDFGLDLPSRDGGRHLPPEARAVAGGGPKCGTPNEPTRIFADIADHLAVPAGEGAYTAGISLHGDADDALAGRNASVALGGAATIVRVVDGLDAGVEAATQPVVAHVGTSPQPFLWFRDAAAAGGVTDAAVLGSARATIAGNNLHNPTTGGIATGSDLLPDGSVNLAVEGDFSIGAFSLGIPADAADPSGVCPAAGAAGSPATGNLAPAAGGPPDRATLGGRNAGTHHLCVRVAAANGAPIPAGLYRGTVSRTGVGDADETLATGVIGRIRRNGTTARLTYLTASGKYNQRLIIVNEGARDARYDLGSLVTEAGTRATPTAAAVGTVPAGGQVVLRVSDLVEFAGPRRRASATLSVVAAPGDIRVATTQVNLLDGSTDTLHIPVRGATVN